MKHLLAASLIPLILTINCGNPAPAAGQANNGLIREWHRRAVNEQDVTNCIIKTRLPNPLSIPVYQRLVQRILQMGTENTIPVFYTYSFNMNLYVILQARCSQKTEIINQIDTLLRQDALVRDFQMRDVGTQEASEVISSLNEPAETAH